MEKEITEAQERLKAMGKEASAVLNIAPPFPENRQVEALADAVRMLMVVMHKHALPPHAAEAVTALAQHLPEEPPSEDYVEEADTNTRGVRRPLPEDADTAMDELDGIEDEDEEALLEMARRLKRARRTAPF